MTRPEQILPADALRRLNRDGWDALTTGERVLMRLRFFDWVSAGEFLDSMEPVDERERWTIASALYRQARLGRIEVRGERANREYRLAAGRRAA